MFRRRGLEGEPLQHARRLGETRVPQHQRHPRPHHVHPIERREHKRGGLHGYEEENESVAR